MGIKDLCKVLKKECPDVLEFKCHLSQLSGYSVAIDSSIFLYTYIKSAGERWPTSWTSLICTLKKHRIKMYFIFDGPNPPAAKKDEQDARRERFRRMIERLETAKGLYQTLQVQYLMNKKEMPEQFKEDCKAVIEKKKKKYKIDYDSPTAIYHEFVDLIQRLENQTTPVSKEHQKMAIEIVETFGIPYHITDGFEAEAYSAFMASCGIVDAVLSEDTDVIACGSPIWLAFRDHKLRDEKLHFISHDHILRSLDFTREQFLDMCILLSCDFNKRIELFPPEKSKAKTIKVGPVKAVNLITEYRCIEEFANNVVDLSRSEYELCRKLFTCPDNFKDTIGKVPEDKKPDPEKIKELFDKYQITLPVNYVLNLWKPVNMVFEDDQVTVDDYFQDIDEDFE